MAQKVTGPASFSMFIVYPLIHFLILLSLDLIKSSTRRNSHYPAVDNTFLLLHECEVATTCSGGGPNKAAAREKPLVVVTYLLISLVLSIDCQVTVQPVRLQEI